MCQNSNLDCVTSIADCTFNKKCKELFGLGECLERGALHSIPSNSQRCAGKYFRISQLAQRLLRFARARKIADLSTYRYIKCL